MYLITASLLNSWSYLLESEYGNIKDFEKVLAKVPTPTTEAIETGFAFEKWCEQNFEETKGGIFQMTAKKVVGNYLLYGRMDCVKAGVIYDYKYTKKYEPGKFLENAQTAMYLELLPEAKKVSYIITDKKDFSNLYREDYTREEIQPIMQTVNQFIAWINRNGYSMEKWVAM